MALPVAAARSREPMLQERDDAIVTLQPATNAEDRPERIRIAPVRWELGKRPREHVALRVAAAEARETGCERSEVAAWGTVEREIEKRCCKLHAHGFRHMALVPFRLRGARRERIDEFPCGINLAHRDQRQEIVQAGKGERRVAAAAHGDRAEL